MAAIRARHGRSHTRGISRGQYITPLTHTGGMVRLHGHDESPRHPDDRDRPDVRRWPACRAGSMPPASTAARSRSRRSPPRSSRSRTVARAAWRVSCDLPFVATPFLQRPAVCRLRRRRGQSAECDPTTAPRPGRMTARPQYAIPDGRRIRPSTSQMATKVHWPVLCGARDPRPRREPDPRVGRVAAEIVQRRQEEWRCVSVRPAECARKVVARATSPSVGSTAAAAVTGMRRAVRHPAARPPAQSGQH